MSSFYTNSDRIVIKTLEEQIINGRRQQPNEKILCTCWAKILNLYGKELYEAMNIKLENTLIFKVRYCKDLEELRYHKDFIVDWKDRKYKIYYSDFTDKQWIKLKCNEVM